jgi:2-polyprenyl-3-methyl-5-hydroxy-6-metoxy-1,4-benzoquinol methylase
VSSSDPIAIDSEQWGPVTIDRTDLEVVAEIAGRPVDECLNRLRSSSPTDLATEWKEALPSSPEAIREFYSRTEGYLWELLAWNASGEYAPYLRRIDRIIELWPAANYPRVLDYGCGLGTAALRLARAGYEVTIADIPGKTLDAAIARLRRHGVEFEVIEVDEDVPRFPRGGWDLLVSFDVLEHVFEPRAVTRALVRGLRAGGGATIVAAFDSRGAEHPQHLGARSHALREHRFQMYLQSLGMKWLGDHVYLRLGRLARVSRLLAYWLWRATGLQVSRPPK